MPTNAQEDSNFVFQQGKHKLIKAKRSHIGDIVPFIRKEDKLEVACMGKTPEQSLKQAFQTDDVTLTIIDQGDVPIAMLGVGKVMNMAYIWMLGTDAVRDASYDFLKASRLITQSLTKPYGATFNFVHKDNTTAIKWLKFCGATFTRKLFFSNEPFYEFIITYREK